MVTDSNYHVDTNDLHNKAQAYTDTVVHKQTVLHEIEQHLNLNTVEERELVLLAGRQEVLKVTKDKLASKLEMLYLSIVKKQETIQKDTSKWIFYYLRMSIIIIHTYVCMCI